MSKEVEEFKKKILPKKVSGLPGRSSHGQWSSYAQFAQLEPYFTVQKPKGITRSITRHFVKQNSDR